MNDGMTGAILRKYGTWPDESGRTGITIRETGVPKKGARFEILVPGDAYRFTGS
jgi:hypothetical protein